MKMMCGNSLKSKNLKSICFKTFILFLFCIVFAIIANKISPKGIPLTKGQWDPAKGTMHGGGPCTPKTREMDITALSHLIEKIKDSLVIVDARAREDYIEAHIPDAVSLPVGEIYALIGDFIKSVSTNKVIITYCAGIECQDSHEIAEILKDAGYENVHVYAQGMPDWLDNNKPVEKGLR